MFCRNGKEENGKGGRKEKAWCLQCMCMCAASVALSCLGEYKACRSKIGKPTEIPACSVLSRSTNYKAHVLE